MYLSLLLPAGRQGARTVLKTLALGSEREVEAEVFSAAEVEARLGLAREDLVAAMLLLGGDFSDGAAGMGPAKTR